MKRVLLLLIILTFTLPTLLAYKIKDDPWTFIQSTINALDKFVDTPDVHEISIPQGLREIKKMPDDEGFWWVEYRTGSKSKTTVIIAQREESSGFLTVHLDDGLWLTPEVWRAQFLKDYSCYYVDCTKMVEKNPFDDSLNQPLPFPFFLPFLK